MEAFVMEIAGLVTQVNPMFMSTREYCRPYLSQKMPEFTMTVAPEDLVFEQEMLDREALEEGLRLRRFTDPFLERMAIQRKIADALMERDTLLLHGSTVGVDGEAFLFTAACGTGKSTHTRFWRETFGPRAVMVNDDKTFLQITDSGVYAYGSPWSGKHGLDTNICLPLRGICILRRGQENRIRRITPAEAEKMLRHQSHMPVDGGEDKVFALVDAISGIVPLWEMACTKDPQAAWVSYRAMSGEESSG